jgi:transmembrane sensor
MQTDNNTRSLPPLQQQAIEWLLRLRTHDLTEAETLEFAEWLSQDLSHSEAFANAEDLYEAMHQAAQLKVSGLTPDQCVAQKPHAIAPKPMTSPRRRTYRWLAVPLGLAAAWLFAVTLVLPQQASLWDAYLSDYHTGTGEQRTFQLADGSHLFLNSDTAISVDYQDTTRQITLHHGQAQFTVAGDKARPFTVSAGELQVRALGTVFEIYRKASGDIDIAVQEHAVVSSLSNGGNTQTPPMQIQQGQQLRYAHGSGTLSPPESTDDELTGAWRKRRVIVKDRPLTELVAEIERYRPGRIFLGGAELNSLRVTGLFSLADPEASLAKVRNILGLKETRLGPWWVLLHR